MYVDVYTDGWPEFTTILVERIVCLNNSMDSLILLYTHTHTPEMEWLQCNQVWVQLLWRWMSTSTQKTNILEYDYFRMYSSMSTITLEMKLDYFNEYLVFTVKVTFIESPGVILFMLLCHYQVF